MYGLLISEAWPQYYASSPFLNLLNLKHPKFEVIPMNSDVARHPELLNKIRSFAGIVIDDVWMGAVTTAMPDIRCPILMVDGDPHRHSQHHIFALEEKYRRSDYVLTGGVFAKKHPRYFYPADELRKQKFVYYPHSAPGGAPPKTNWSDRSASLLVSGSISNDVYPYRVLASRVTSAQILPFQSMNHMDYFRYVSKYKTSVACQSVLEYTVAKYFEIPWCGTALVAQPPAHGEADILGFKHEENCFLFGHPGEITGVPASILEIAAKNGQELILKRHTIDSRGDYLAALLDKIIAGGFKPDDAFDIFKSVPERSL